jgi:tetratricopeptide (TPR) repeat protein
VTKVSNVEDVRGARGSEWEQSFETLTALDASETLGAEDVEALGEAAWWTGRLRESIAARERALGHEFGDPDLVALGQYIEGRLLVRQGQVYDGMATLDEAMLAAAQGELGPMATGQIYCNVIAACQELGDLRRAGEWTEALSGWCANQPASVFPGLCRVHRAEVMRLRGAWSEAEHEARRASEDLLESMPAFASEAFYQLGEVRRQHGELDEAELEFRRASDLGREPQPGLALVRLAQGKTAAAAAAVRRALAQESNRLTRAKLLSAQAAAAFARGRVELNIDQVPLALASLRLAWKLWQAADCPFEAAEARRGRQEQPRDRGGAPSQREDDCAPPFQHLRQDRRVLAGRGDGVRLRARADQRGVVGSHWVT